MEHCSVDVKELDKLVSAERKILKMMCVTLRNSITSPEARKRVGV